MTNPLENNSDEAVINAVLDGDKNAYGILIDRYKNLVFQLALNQFKNNEVAEDISQEVFTKAYQNLDRLKNKNSFAAWINTITRSVCRDMKRKRRIDTVPIDDLQDQIADQHQTAEESSYSPALMQLLIRIIEDLPEKHSTILKLRYCEDYNCKKIAEFLGINERSVVNRLYYARNLILKRVKKEKTV